MASIHASAECVSGSNRTRVCVCVCSAECVCVWCVALPIYEHSLCVLHESESQVGEPHGDGGVADHQVILVKGWERGGGAVMMCGEMGGGTHDGPRVALTGGL